MPSITLRLKTEVDVMSQKSTPTKSALTSSESGIAEQYLDLQRLREEVRRAEISFGIRMHSPKGGTRSKRRSR
jgi:hypothetical protein